MKEKSYWICTAEGHPSVLEIIAEEDLEKYEQTEGGYVRLQLAHSRQDAISIVQNMLEVCAAKDPSMQHIKEVLVEVYG